MTKSAFYDPQKVKCEILIFKLLALRCHYISFKVIGTYILPELFSSNIILFVFQRTRAMVIGWMRMAQVT